jgi:hypothetical protein
MTIERPHTLRAFLLAPLIGPILWSGVVGVSWAKGPLYVLGEVGLVVLSSLPFIYGAALLVGFPAYWLIRRWWQLKSWHSAVIGAVLGGVVLPMTDRLPCGARGVGLGALVGLAAGALFWVLWRPRSDPALNPTGVGLAG